MTDDNKNCDSNSEITITKIPPKTRSQTNLHKMQQALQKSLQNSLAIATNNNMHLINPQKTLTYSPKPSAYASSQPISQHCILNDQQQNFIDCEMKSASNSASSSPTSGNVKKKRVYRRKTQTIRKIIEDETEVDDLAKSADEKSRSLNTLAHVTDIFKTTKVSKLDVRRNGVSIDKFTPSSTNRSVNDDINSHEDSSRDSRL